MDAKATIVASIIGAIVAILGVFLTNNVTKMNELDSKSGWRNKLFDLASKDRMTLDDVYLLRATLRFNHHIQPFELYSFKFMSNQITDFCDNLIEKHKDDVPKEVEATIKKREITDFTDREIIRIYARYLLKNHWEVFSSKIFFFSNEFKLKKEHEIGKETYELIEEIKEKRRI